MGEYQKIRVIDKITYNVSIIAEVDIYELAEFLRSKGIAVERITAYDKSNNVLIFKDKIKREN